MMWRSKTSPVRRSDPKTDVQSSNRRFDMTMAVPHASRRETISSKNSTSVLRDSHEAHRNLEGRQRPEINALKTAPTASSPDANEAMIADVVERVARSE